jgi:O-antigen/teichoic acid export membrane protein
VKQSSLISHAALSTAGVLVQGLSRFAFTALIGRLMGASELAHVSAWLSLALILSLLWPTGAGNAASQFLASALARGDDPRPVLRALESSFWKSCVVMVVVGVPVAIFLLRSDAADAVAVAALVVAYSGYIFTRGIQVGLGRLVDTSVWDLATALITWALVVPVFLADLDSLVLWPITIGYAIFGIRVLATAHGGHAATSAVPVGVVARSDRHDGAPLDGTTEDGARHNSATQHGATTDASVDVSAASVPTRLLWHTIRWNSLGLLASNGLIQFSMLFVFALFPPLVAGLYAAAMALATPASMLSQAISQVLLARFSHWAETEPATAHRRFLRVLGGMSALLTVVFALVAVASALLLQLVFGSDYSDAEAPLQVLLAAVLAFSITLVVNAYLQTVGRTAQATLASLAGLVVGLVVMVVLVLVGWWGPLAAAGGVLFGYLLTMVLAIGFALARNSVRPLPRWLTAPLQ